MLLFPAGTDRIRRRRRAWARLAKEEGWPRNFDAVFGRSVADLARRGPAFGAAIPRVVIVVAVPIVLAVGFVVFVVVSDEIVSANPSCEVTKLMVASGAGRVLTKVGATGQAVRELGRCVPSSPFQYGVRVPYLPFHSDQGMENCPPGSRPHPRPTGSAIKLTRDKSGSCRHEIEKKRRPRATKCSSRPSADARSKRNPSTCISVTQ